jgi:hypothetical protein
MPFHAISYLAIGRKNAFSSSRRHAERLRLPARLARNPGYEGEPSGLSAAPANPHFDGPA